MKMNKKYLVNDIIIVVIKEIKQFKCINTKKYLELHDLYVTYFVTDYFSVAFRSSNNIKDIKKKFEEYLEIRIP